VIKTKIITVNTIRGGSGKTLFSILLSKYLPGNKLLIDFDIQNSLTYWSGIELNGKSIFNAIINDDFKNNIQTINDNTSIIASDIKLLDIQNLEPNRLGDLKKIKGYDYIIIDTPPTYSGLLYNAFQISDIVILPVMLDLFSFKSLEYTVTKLIQMKKKGINIFINQFEKSRYDASHINQLINLLKQDKTINKYLSKVRIPKSVLFKQLSDNVLDNIPNQKKTKELINTINDFIGEIK